MPEPTSRLVCVFCNGELRVETISKYDVFLIMCDGCGQEMIDCQCIKVQQGHNPADAGGHLHHRR